jgi:signal transduction histidine kinase
MDVADIMRASAGRKKVMIETKLKDGLPSMYADPDRMRQILFNLVGNAIKYTHEGDSVIIETGSKEDRVLFMVADHGPGIPESEMPRLFDLYHRTEEARQSRTKGLGLGLFIVKSLVDLHNGQISARSELGKGTQFTVSIPVHQAGMGGSG